VRTSRWYVLTAHTPRSLSRSTPCFRDLLTSHGIHFPNCPTSHGAHLPNLLTNYGTHGTHLKIFSLTGSDPPGRVSAVDPAVWDTASISRWRLFICDPGVYICSWPRRFVASSFSSRVSTRSDMNNNKHDEVMSPTLHATSIGHTGTPRDLLPVPEPPSPTVSPWALQPTPETGSKRHSVPSHSLLGALLTLCLETSSSRRP